MMSNLDDIMAAINQMRSEHDWQKSDTVNVLIKSIVVEANELLEAYLLDEHNSEALRSELADVLMYALSLADDLGYDIETIIKEKIAEVNQRNYEQ